MIDLSPYDKDLVIVTKAGNVPVYKFIERFLKVQDKDGNVVPFILNEAQREVYILMCKRRRNGQPIRENILKARQLGISTFIAAVIFVMCISKPNQNAAIVADIANHATNLFDKYKFYYWNLPEEIRNRIPLVRSNAKELIFDFGNGLTSSIKIMVQGDNAGRSGTYQFLHLSECAFWDNLKKTLVSLLQTVSQNNKDSMVFLETTGNGFNEYKTRWDNDVVRGNYDPVFLGWFLDKNYVRETPLDLNYEPFELEMFERLGFLTDEQKYWYHAQLADIQDLDSLKQEFPSTPIEAFITTGASFYAMALVNQQKEYALKHPPVYKLFSYEKEVSRDGQQITMSNIKWLNTSAKTGVWRVYEEPKAGHPYIVGNDPAKGGANKFAVVVWDNAMNEIVAIYDKAYGNEDEVAFQMYCAVVAYNNALLTGEVNTGGRLLELCFKCGYKKIYQEQDEDDLTKKFANHFGYKTKSTNRQPMLNLSQEMFRDKPSSVRDYELLCEMEGFQNINGKWQASVGCTDDILLAWCGILYCRHFQTSLITQEKVIENKNEFNPMDFGKDETNNEVFIQWD